MFGGGLHNRYVIDTSKTTQFSDAWVFLALIFVALGLILHNLFLSAAGALLLVVAGLGWVWNKYALHNLDYSRKLSERRAFPGEELTLTLSVNNHKFLPLSWLIVRDLFPTGLPINDKELTANPSTNLIDFNTFWMPGGRQKISRDFIIKCQVRGYYRFGPATLESGDAFGFFEKRGTERRFTGTGIPGERGTGESRSHEDYLIIYPRIYSVAELQLPSRNPFGAQRSKLVLHEDPLRSAGIRAWQPEDDVRRIHWMASARQQTLLSRIYEPSEEQQVVIFMNVATLERHWQGVIVDLLELVVSVSASIAALALDARIPTGMIANAAIPGGEQEVRLLPGRSPSQLMHILELLAGVTPFATAPIEELVQREAQRIPWGATLVVVTAMAHDELLAILEEIGTAGRRVVLITLAEEPPRQWLRRVEVWHLPHLVDGVVVPERVDATSAQTFPSQSKSQSQAQSSSSVRDEFLRAMEESQARGSQRR